MIHKWPVQCGHCNKTVGFSIYSGPMGTIYCYACEPVVTHREEMREEEMVRYREAAGRC